MTVCALSMIGLPPRSAGFFSKWYLALGAIQKGQYLFVAALILSSLLSAIYFFRLLEHVFMDPKKERRDKYPKAELPVADVGTGADRRDCDRQFGFVPYRDRQRYFWKGIDGGDPRMIESLRPVAAVGVCLLAAG